MESLRIGIAQINTTVGALAANAAKIQAASEKLAAAGADLILFPEMAICGYPPEDLMMKAHFVEDCQEQIQALAETLPKDPVILLGAPTPPEITAGGGAKPFNSAVVLSGGKMAATYHKAMLPNYAIFDEQRVFHPGTRPMCLHLSGTKIGIHICEDSWTDDPHGGAFELDHHLLVNLSASPYYQNKLERIYIHTTRS